MDYSAATRLLTHEEQATLMILFILLIFMVIDHFWHER